MDPSKNTTSTPNNSPPVSPPHDNTPTETNPIPDAEASSENIIMKTAEQVWAELTAGDDEIHGTEGADGGNEDGGAPDGGDSRPLVIALAVDGANVPVMGSGGAVGGSGKGKGKVSAKGNGKCKVNAKGMKKRKSNQVRNPPRGTPTCPECKRQFATWKAAFGHMRKHPERRHRGFYPPPTFVPQQLPTVEGDQVNEEVQHVVRGLVVDLNRSLPAEVGTSAAGGSGGKQGSQAAPFVAPQGSSAARTPPRLSALRSRNRRNEPAPPAPPAADDEQNEAGRNRGFDLNRLPSSDDESGEN